MMEGVEVVFSLRDLDRVPILVPAVLIDHLHSRNVLTTIEARGTSRVPASLFGAPICFQASARLRDGQDAALQVHIGPAQASDL